MIWKTPVPKSTTSSPAVQVWTLCRVLSTKHGLDVDRLREDLGRRVVRDTGAPTPHRGSAQPVAATRPGGLADEVDGVILEDDYDAEFRYDRQPVGSLQGLNSTRVIALGSVSKTLLHDPARLGAGARHGWWRDHRGEEAKQSGAPGLDQEALALLMETGRFDRHLRRVREVLPLPPGRPRGRGRSRLRAGSIAGAGSRVSCPAASPGRDIRGCRQATAATMGVRVNGLGRYRFVASDRKSN